MQWVLAHRNLKKAQRKRNNLANQRAQDVEYKVGNPVMYKNHHRKKNKLDSKWIPHYYVVEVKSPVTCVIRNQLTTHQVKTHVAHIRHTPVEEWITPDKPTSEVPRRRAAYVVPPDQEESGSSKEELEPQEFLQKLYRQEHSDSSEDDNIPHYLWNTGQSQRVLVMRS